MMKPKRDVIDLSHWNTVDNFHEVYDSGVVGVIHKVTQGSMYVDSKYYSRVVHAKAAGLLWGRYHFGTDDDVQDQVKNFLTGWQRDELLALDLENNVGGTMSLKQAEEFLSEVETRTNQSPVLYGGNLIKEYMLERHSGILPQFRLWLAHYNDKPTLPHGWHSAWLWQYTDSSRGPQPHGCPGIAGNVDCSAYDGTRDQLISEWTGNRAVPPLVA